MRISISRLLLIGSALLLLAACNGGKSGDHSAVLATVNGTPITQNMFQAYVRSLTGGRDLQLTQHQKDQVLDRLIDMTILADVAKKGGLEKDPKVAEQLDFLAVQKLGILAQSQVNDYMKKHPVSDDQLKSAYAAQIKNEPTTEYHARHILVSSEAEAKKLIGELKHGANFAKLAEKYSKDTDSAKKGGDLGWFLPNTMVPPFATALENLKKGEITQTPVQTQYGWHVIQLEGTRASSPPSLDSMRQNLENKLENNAVQKYVDGLRKQANVDIKKAPPPASTSAPQKAAPAQDGNAK